MPIAYIQVALKKFSNILTFLKTEYHDVYKEYIDRVNIANGEIRKKYEGGM